MNKIKFIYFDLGGVFFHWQIGTHKMAEYFNRPYEEFERIRRQYDDTLCRGKMSTGDLWKKFKEGLGLMRERDFIFPDSWVNEFTPIPETHRLASELSAKYRLGVLTNIYPGIYDDQVKLYLVPHLNYEIVIKSYEVGLVKPESEIYELARTKAGVQPEEILYTDDIKVNIKAAQRQGWQTVWFDEKNPERSVESIREYLAQEPGE